MNEKGLYGKMVLRIHKKKENRMFKVYMIAMFALLVARYVLKVNVPAMAFLMVSMIPIWWGTVTEQLAFVASCIPFSVTFQYKYAMLILAVAILIKNRWKLKKSGLFILVMAMMAWELWHAVYGHFSYVEYLRDFAELILLGIVTSVDLHDLDHKLVIRSLAISVVGVCAIMLWMQMEQFGFDLIAVFARSARSFRFGQSNMESGTYALNYNANNLGFICNLSLCGLLLLVVKKEHQRLDIVMAVLSAVFALMTLSRAAIVCLAMVFVAYVILAQGKLIRKIWSGIGGILLAIVACILVWQFLPSVFENILERFQRADVWNGRGSLLRYYGQFLFSSWKYLLFGVGLQDIFGKVSPKFPVHDVPHMGMQEVWVAWGIIGVAMMLWLFWKIIATSKLYAGGKRLLYQFMPLGLTLVFTMSGQLLTSSRALMALIFAHICLCIHDNDRTGDGLAQHREDI